MVWAMSPEPDVDDRYLLRDLVWCGLCAVPMKAALLSTSRRFYARCVTNGGTCCEDRVLAGPIQPGQVLKIPEADVPLRARRFGPACDGGRHGPTAAGR